MADRQKPLILLDRDGTLITEQDYLKDPDKVKFLPGSVAGLRRLYRAGFPMVVVSNQSGIGRGLMSARDVQRVMARFRKELLARGIRLQGVYWCPHHPKIPCTCRKPNLGLVRRAARALKRSWKGAISVGDKWCDVELGQRTGGRGLLVRTGYGRITLQDKGSHPKPAYIARNFDAASRWILKTEKRSRSHDNL